MNPPSTLEFRNTDLARRSIYALRISIILTVTYIFTLALSTYLAIVNRQWQFFALMGLTAAMTTVNLIAMRFVRQKRIELAVIFIIAQLAIQLPILVSVFTGIGLVLGLAG